MENGRPILRNLEFQHKHEIEDWAVEHFGIACGHEHIRRKKPRQVGHVAENTLVDHDERDIVEEGVLVEGTVGVQDARNECEEQHDVPRAEPGKIDVEPGI